VSGRFRISSNVLASVSSVTIGLLGWLPLVLSAGLAQGNGDSSSIALALGLAGAAGLGGMVLAIVGWLGSPPRPIFQIVSACGMLISGALSFVAFIFVLSFHW
jgi:hypothetical protein